MAGRKGVFLCDTTINKMEKMKVYNLRLFNTVCKDFLDEMDTANSVYNKLKIGNPEENVMGFKTISSNLKIYRKHFCKTIGNHLWITVSLLCAVVSFVLGFVGYCRLAKVESMEFTEILYRTFQLFPMNADPTKFNIPISIARITAPLSLYGTLASVFADFMRSFSNVKRLADGNSVAVYGDSEEADFLRKKYRKEKLLIEVRDDSFVIASRYALFYKESRKNMDFYNDYEVEMMGKPIAISSPRPKGSIPTINCNIVNCEAEAAVQFWIMKSKGLFDKLSGNRELRIAVIGEGTLAEEVLMSGWMMNQYYTDQKIHYDLFGKHEEFFAKHPKIEEMKYRNGAIAYHPEWDYNVLMKADLIVFTEQKEQERRLEELKNLIPSAADKIYVFADGIGHIGDKEENLFRWRETALSDDILFSTVRNEQAKDLHNLYMDEDPLGNQEIWESIPAFTRSSNYAAMDYHEIRLKIYPGRTFNIDDIEANEEMARLEHERWCRFHYIANWKSKKLAKDKKDNKEDHKDVRQHTHRDLRRWEDLPDIEQNNRKQNNIDFIKKLYQVKPSTDEQQ